jgi:hypothetical protein
VFLVFLHFFFVTVCVFRMNPKKPTFIMTQNHDFDMCTVPGPHKISALRAVLFT